MREKMSCSHQGVQKFQNIQKLLVSDLFPIILACLNIKKAQESLGSCDELYSPSNSSLNVLLTMTIDGTVVMDQMAYSLLEPLIAAQISHLLPGSYALDASKYLHKICQLMRSLFKPCSIRGYHVFANNQNIVWFNISAEILPIKVA